jgi:hypothetical protein
MFGPIMQRRRIEVGAVWPNERVGLWVDPNLIEEIKIPERSKQLSSENGLKVDGLLHAIVESDAQRIRSDDCKFDDAVNRMSPCLVFRQNSSPFGISHRSAAAEVQNGHGRFFICSK